MFKEQSVFYRIASRKSSLFRFTHLFSSHAVLVPPRPHRLSSALYWRSIWHHEREKEEDSSWGNPGEESISFTHRSPAVGLGRRDEWNGRCVFRPNGKWYDTAMNVFVALRMESCHDRNVERALCK
jgi:hypothetical protein